MILLKNATVINFYPAMVKTNLDILIKEAAIFDVGKSLTEKNKPKIIIDCTNKIVSAGLVCSHNHFYSVLARGIIANLKPSNDFISILKNLWWKLDKAIDEETLYYSGLIGCIEAIKCGTTSVIDHNSSPSFIKNSLSTLKKAFEKTGLRGVLCYEITDRNGDNGFKEGFGESVSFANLIEKENNDLIKYSIGGHASFTLNNSSLKEISKAIRKTRSGFHIHVAEDKYDSSFTHHFFEKDILERLEQFDLLNDKSILVHGVHLNEKEISIINKYDSFLIHNPRSNMNNNVGYLKNLFKIKNIALGTDGIGSDMLEEIKFAYFKNKDENCKIEMNDWMRVFQSGNKILERYFNSRKSGLQKKFGLIEKGHAADLVIYDYQSPTPLLDKNIAGHIIYGLSSRDVETVIINGKIVYKERKFIFDTNPIYMEARKQAKSLWSRISKF